MHQEKQDWLHRVMASRLNPGTKVFAYGVFKHMYGNKTSAFPSEKALMETTHLSRGYFSKYRTALTEVGALTKELEQRGEHKSYTYHLNLEWDGTVPEQYAIKARGSRMTQDAPDSGIATPDDAPDSGIDSTEDAPDSGIDEDDNASNCDIVGEFPLWDAANSGIVPEEPAHLIDAQMSQSGAQDVSIRCGNPSIESLNESFNKEQAVADAPAMAASDRGDLTVTESASVVVLPLVSDTDPAKPGVFSSDVPLLEEPTEAPERAAKSAEVIAAGVAALDRDERERFRRLTNLLGTGPKYDRAKALEIIERERSGEWF